MTGADAKAALERGRPVVLVHPPAPEQARELWELLGPATGQGPGVGLRVLIICADDGAAAEWAAAAPSDRQAVYAFNADRAAATETDATNAYRYHGGPKYND